MRETVLVTGGLGYLGGRIAVRIAEDPGCRVRIGSRRVTSAPVWLPKADMVSMDALHPEALPAALKGVGAVVHLAAMNEIDSAADPQKAFQINTLGTRHLLDAAIAAGVKRFVYFSTVHVYGAPLAGHITEKTEPRPAHPYATTHYEAEKFVRTAHTQGVIEGIVVRLSNGFGAPTHPDVNRWTLLVNALSRQAVQERKLVVHSSGLQKRDFITLHDVACATEHLLRLPREECGDGVFNVGGECPMTVLAMAERVARCCDDVFGYRPEIIKGKPVSGEQVFDLDFDIRKLKATGFRLSGNMDDEIRRTLQMCAGMPKEGRS